MPMWASSRPEAGSGGFTLLEVLVAVLIFSLGLVGLAGLMVISVKTNQSAYLRTQADDFPALQRPIHVVQHQQFALGLVEPARHVAHAEDFLRRCLSGVG